MLYNMFVHQHRLVTVAIDIKTYPTLRFVNFFLHYTTKFYIMGEEHQHLKTFSGTEHTVSTLEFVAKRIETLHSCFSVTLPSPTCSSFY